MNEGRLRIAIAAVALLGVGIATYLTVVHYTHATVVCVTGGGGCETVQQSAYADVGGIPVALLGLGGYLLIFAANLVPGDAGRVGGFCLALTGVAFSAYLTYLELFVINAICQWCVGSAVVMCVLLVLSSLRLRHAWQAPLAEKAESART